METPMRRYGLNLAELFLEDFMTVLGWLLIAFTIASRILASIFWTDNFTGGLIVAISGLTGLVLILASAGIRQNYAALDLSYLLFALTSLGWLVHGILSRSIAALVSGIVILPLFGLMIYLRRLAIQARFKPRFFSLRQFETMIQIADTMIETNGQNAIHPIEVAIRIDHFLARFDAIAKQDIKKTLNIVEWLLPLVIWRPFPFSTLGSHERRRAVEKVIGARGVFRDVARFLKLLSCAGYYGSPEGMAQVGYIPFEDRVRSKGVSQTARQYSDLFSPGAER